MKIVMLTSSFYDTDFGGLEGHIFYLANALVARGHDVQVVRHAPREATGQVPSDFQACYTVLPSAIRPSRRTASILRAGRRTGLLIELGRRMRWGLHSRHLVNEAWPFVADADVVHQHDFVEGIGLTRALNRRGKTVVWTNHLGEFLYLERLPFASRILDAMTSHFAAATAPSRELASESVAGLRFHLIPNGVDTARFAPITDPAVRGRIREELRWPQHKFVVIVPRRWAPTKGVLYAARAMGFPRWPRDTFVVFAGSGTSEYPAYHAEIRAALAQTAVDHVVLDRVEQPAMAQMLAVADACLIPSVKEATSLSALEAMSAGTPVVAARTGGLVELIQHGHNGLLHEVGDPADIVRMFLELRTHNLDQMSLRARASVIERYSWDAIACLFENMYGDVA